MKFHSILTAAALTASLSAFGSPAKISAAIDSTVIEMGSHAAITVTIIDPDGKGEFIDLPEKGAQFDSFDVADVKADTLPTGMSYNIDIQAFIPGVLTFDSFRYVVGGDTLTSDPITIKVLPVELDSLQTINPLAGTVNIPSKWYDFIPDWWIWVVLGLLFIILCVVGWFLYRTYKATGSILPIHQKPVDPYVWATGELDKLRSQKLAESGRSREYYTTLVDILRIYLKLRFNINAMEMPTTQILRTLHDTPETRNNEPLIKQILEVADFVKFANVRSVPDSDVRSFNNAVQFVEATKPIVEPENANTDQPQKVKKK